ncbi:MAG: GNAT family N-acetyltransferase [Spirochaetales bacterium]|nr:GNAT family N-acetyltransferase [Spirochaetales bacterium]
MTSSVTYGPAIVGDVDGIFKLVSRMAQSGLMLRRSKYRIVTTLTNFVVAAADDGQLAGCGALLPLWTDSAEIVALAVDERFQRSGVGKGLVRELLERGRRLGFPEIITLTYEVQFFAGLGFESRPKDSFPRKLWRECLECPRLEECDETAMSIRLDVGGARRSPGEPKDA